MKFEVEKKDNEIQVNGKKIILFELTSIDLFSKNEAELDLVMKQFQEFFHSIKDIRMQILVKSRFLHINDIKEHLSYIRSGNKNVIIYIQDLMGLISSNEIPFKKYYLVFEDNNKLDFIDSLKARFVQIGFILREIDHKEFMKIANEIFND